MAAQCAVCRQPITKKTNFRVVETEAVHDECLSRVHDSLVTRLRQHVVTFRDRSQRANQDLQRARADLEQAQRDLQRLQREHDLTTGELERLKIEYKSVANTYATEYQRRHAAQHEAAQERERRVAAERERDAARSELALHQTLSRAAPSPAPEAEPAKDERDATSVRFSLLDMD